MMKKLLFGIIALCWFSAGFALSGQAYMERFNHYWNWYQQLPFNPSADFLTFVEGKTTLSNKLRDKWLYELARKKEWQTYVAYFQPTNDLNLTCYYEIAKYNLGRHDEVLREFVPIWLSGESRPKSCDTLFELVLKDPQFDQNLITKRLDIALDKRNIHLARYLLKRYKTPRLADADLIVQINQNPTLITRLQPGGLNGYFYLFGLKRLVSLNMDKAISIWNQPKSRQVMNEAQQQEFISQIALYKAVRNHEDAGVWFGKLKTAYKTDVIKEWEIRLALKNREWRRVTYLIKQFPDLKSQPSWQYWLARSLEKQHKMAEAREIYEPLSKLRNYYGFLASIRIKKTPSVVSETPSTDFKKLVPYQPIIAQIESLYRGKKINDASRLLNDFISELPKDEASALVYWVEHQLHWHAKTIYLSSNDTLSDQIALRFPLAYESAVKSYAQKYAVPPEFVYAIIRQESSFREDVTSSAGAKGLMQIMPRTAHLVSKSNHIYYSDPKQLYQSYKNINIGIAYLKDLAKRFSQHPVLMAAAYNAGPSQVVYWLKNHPPRDIDIWIETLPWQETRNYLKNVTAFYVVYQYRLNRKPNLNAFLEPF